MKSPRFGISRIRTYCVQKIESRSRNWTHQTLLSKLNSVYALPGSHPIVRFILNLVHAVCESKKLRAGKGREKEKKREGVRTRIFPCTSSSPVSLARQAVPRATTAAAAACHHRTHVTAYGTYDCLASIVNLPSVTELPLWRPRLRCPPPHFIGKTVENDDKDFIFTRPKNIFDSWLPKFWHVKSSYWTKGIPKECVIPNFT